MRFVRHCHGAVYIAAFLLVPQLLLSQPQETARASIKSSDTPQVVSDVLWKHALRTCPVNGSQDKRKPAISGFYLDFAMGLKPTLVEYRNPWTTVFSDKLSEADRLNGIQFRGMTVLGADAYRSIPSDPSYTTRAWSEWQEMAFGKDAVVKMIATGSPWGGVVIRMEKRNDQWSFVLPGPLGVVNEKFDPDATAAQRLSCERSFKKDPFRTPEDDAPKFICPGDVVIPATFCNPPGGCSSLTDFTKGISRFMPADRTDVLRKGLITGGIDTGAGYVFQIQGGSQLYRFAEGKPNLSCSTPDAPPGFKPTQYICPGIKIEAVACGSKTQLCNGMAETENSQIYPSGVGKRTIQYQSKALNVKTVTSLRSMYIFQLENDDRVYTIGFGDYGWGPKGSCPSR